ncbi:ribonuclease P protein component [Neptunomonas antarctica]|jgi:ribonuclease P protein component|uniref:Ribonuclease P protein component n=1 Tax=Neptunomonas antarctica TaxID=619304 RepID=A0A1N7ITP5_9GAMM|nr:ribonuclease P protein component [Neptunomonas antarctica]SIS40386.1 ribonuclease P protein component [Neptunomonas antarctica]
MTEFGYPRQLRLLTAGDFQKVFDSVTIKVPEQRILILARLNGLEHPRLGFVISKKNVRRAVKRNHVRRIIRESFRLKQHDLPPVDMIILARPGLGDMSASDLNRLAEKCWSRLNKKAKNVLNKQD